MTYITVCDARQPVPISISEGNSISMTTMSLIYDFYDVSVPQEKIKYKNIKKDDDDKIYFDEYPEGTNFRTYYEDKRFCDKQEFS